MGKDTQNPWSGRRYNLLSKKKPLKIQKRVHTIDQIENTLAEASETKGQGQGNLYDFILTDQWVETV